MRQRCRSYVAADRKPRSSETLGARICRRKRCRYSVANTLLGSCWFDVVDTCRWVGFVCKVVEGDGVSSKDMIDGFGILHCPWVDLDIRCHRENSDYGSGEKVLCYRNWPVSSCPKSYEVWLALHSLPKPVLSLSLFRVV